MTKFRTYLLTFAILCATGCALSSDPMRFSAASVAEISKGYVVLRERVSGEDCPVGKSRYGSYAVATKKAIETVPGANALVNVTISRENTSRLYAKLCAQVIGDAVRL